MPRLSESEKQKVIDDCRDALLSVAPEYFSSNLPGGKRSYGERVFAYEFYHQIRCKINFQTWYVDGEFRKGLSLANASYSQEVVIPDIVIHHSDSLENNVAAFEIKTGPSTSGKSILQDLSKLELYTRPLGRYGLNFQIGILILINQDFTQTIKRTGDICRKEILNLLDSYPRLAVWNIAQPRSTATGPAIKLSADCLTIFRKGTLPQCD